MPFQRTFDEPEAALEPLCRSLRSKAMFVTGQMEVVDVPQTGSGHCWCNETQNVFGPDAQLVSRRACNSGRPCYRAAL